MRSVDGRPTTTPSHVSLANGWVPPGLCPSVCPSNPQHLPRPSGRIGRQTPRDVLFCDASRRAGPLDQRSQRRSRRFESAHLHSLRFLVMTGVSRGRPFLVLGLHHICTTSGGEEIVELVGDGPVDG